MELDGNMATLIHITDEKYEKSILKNGIKIGKDNKVVYFMPLFKDYLISHQWARELKRWGTKNFMAVYFKIKSDEVVWFGHYNKKHEQMKLSEAMKRFLELDDPLGYEFTIERKIIPKEIVKIRHITKPMGWRYKPHIHGEEPSSSPMILQAGGYKTVALKEKVDKLSYKEAKEILIKSDDVEELLSALYDFMGKKRRESPIYLERLLAIDDEWLLYALVQCLAEFRDPLAREYLTILASSNDEDVAELAKEYLDDG